MTNFQSYDVEKFPSVFLTADVVVLQQKNILLIERAKDPYKNCWALPGGFFDVPTDSDIAHAATRELYEETNIEIEPRHLKLVGVFSKKNRDPRESLANKLCRIISTAYVIELTETTHLKAKDDAKSLRWFPITALPKLAFDHEEIIKAALKILELK